MDQLEKAHLIGELATHRGYRLLIEQLKSEFSTVEQNLEKSTDERVDISLSAQWKVYRKILRRLEQLPEDCRRDVSARAHVSNMK